MIDPSLATLTAVVAVCASHTALELAVRLSTSRRSLALYCKTLCGALALGAGLWCVMLLGLLSVSIPPWPASHGLAVFASLAVAIAGQGLALAILAGRQPDFQRILASASASSAAICATCLTGLVTLAGPRVSRELLSTLAISGALAVTPATAALWLRYSLGSRRSLLVGAAKCLAVVLSALAIAGIHALTLAKGQVGFGGHSAVAAAPIIAIALAATGLGALAVIHAITVYDGRLALRIGQCARELDEVHTRLQYLATHDSLTGLPNWLLFRERLAQAVAATERPGRAIAVAVLDLDRFSSLNHSLGHGAGDWLLTEVALRVGAVLRPGDLLARLGSDEFVVLIDSVAARVDAEAITAAVLAALTVPIGVNGAEVHVRPSIGVSIWPDDGRRVDDLLTHAEVAMAVAKKRGGNETQFFEHGMTDSMHERLVLENDLRRALSAGEFELAFQPVLSTKSGRIVTAEALVRWRHPLRGLIGPNSFIPLAEETGLMIPLGEWVVREVCRQASVWQLDRGTPIRLAVNLSATQFRHQNLLEVIRSALAAENLDARYLEVELTETSVMTNPEESAGVLRQLRKMGVTVAVDDFGTGYSSLSYLRRFPIDKLKIDRSFVRDLTTSRTDESIVRAIIALAHSVGLEVVAEGVETAEQLRCVSELGCDQWQGFYCCEPQPAARFGQMLQEQTGGTRTGLVAALTR
jgi:diguanylate cyclase (GGDEF)-like protein